MKELSTDVMIELQKEYIATFDEKSKNLHSALASRNWVDLQTHLHKLAGSGSTYLMPEITTLARAAEELLKKQDQPNIKTLSESIKLLDEAFDARRKAA